MQKVDGVQAVRVSLKDGLVVMDFKPGNTVMMAKLREIIKNNGFVSKEAVVLARGSSSAANAFEVSGTRERLTVTTQPVAEAGDQWRMTSLK